MNIYYIRHREDNPEEDGIWLTSEYQQFFVSVDAAAGHCRALNAVQQINHDARKENARVKWELDDVAFRALERAGIDAKKTLPYHKPEFSYQEYKPTYVIDQLEVKE